MLNPAFYATWQPRVLALLRITTAYMFLLHGTAKLFGVPHVAMFDKLQIMSLSGFAGILEVVGGVLLILACSRARRRSSSPARWPLPTSWAMPFRRAGCSRR
jgi:hypothetical protein